MSHVVVKKKVRITSLPAAAKAAERCGMKLKEGQTTYRWWGRYVGDSPMAEGMTLQDLGRCQHAISVRGKPEAYEIGLFPAKDEQGGWFPVYDYYRGGYGLENAAGHGLCRFLQEYNKEVALQAALGAGYEYREVRGANGDIVLEVVV